MDDYLCELRRENNQDASVQMQFAILEQLEELNRTLLKLAENVTSCTYVYRGEPVVRTDPIR